MTNAMEKEFYIFGEPIDTELGQVRFLTYKEYLMNINDLSTISMNILHIYYQYRKVFDKGNEEAMAALEELKQGKLYDFVSQSRDFWEAYVNVLSLVMEDDDMVARVMEDAELFMRYRDLVMDMNMMQEEAVSPNPEVQEFNERGKRIKSVGGEKQTFSDIVSSIAVGSSHSFREIANLTVLQVYSIFYRIGAVKNHEITALFATVSSEVKLEAWNKHIDLFKSATDTIDKKEFDKQYGGLF